MRRLRKHHLPVAPVLPLLCEYPAKHQRLLDTSEFSLRRLSEETGISRLSPPTAGPRTAAQSDASAGGHLAERSRSP